MIAVLFGQQLLRFDRCDWLLAPYSSLPLFFGVGCFREWSFESFVSQSVSPQAKIDASTMMNGRLFLGRLRPRRLTWTLLVGIIMMFALSSSANEVRFHKKN